MPQATRGNGLNERPRAEYRSTGAIRGFAQRFALFGVLMMAVGLMVLGKADTVVMERFRGTIADAVAPVLDALSRPADVLADTMDGIRSWVQVQEQNQRLLAERQRLLRWQDVALRLEAENAALKRLLNYVPDPQTRSVSARVIADPGGTFAHSLLLYAGAENGIRKGDAVVTGEGMIGRIINVSARSSRLLLITDLNSRIPISVLPARTRAVLAGDNTDRPKLLHLLPEASISPGDRVVTSGDAGALPPGLPVGVIASVGEQGIAVKPFVEASRLEHVRVIGFELRAMSQGGPRRASIVAAARKSAKKREAGASAPGGAAQLAAAEETRAP